MKDFIGIILAAGEGTRMKSSLPKVLHNICGRPMIDYVIDSLKNTHAKKIVVVVNKQQAALLEYLKKNKNVKVVFQNKPYGTADALSCAKTFFSKTRVNLLVICADTPLIKNETLVELISKHKETNSSCTILTAFLDNPFGLGRIVRDSFSKASRIVEENDADFAQKQIKEINSGIYCFKEQDLLEALKQVQINTKKKEYYLTDVVEILYKQNKKIETYVCSDGNEALGINSRLDLSKADEIMHLRIIEEFMDEGVAVVDPKSTFINYGVTIGKDTTIYPFTIIEPGVEIGDNCSIGPFCHLREGTVIKDNNSVGNFIEIVRSQLGEGTFFKHFGYLGDASVGKNVNIGAGTAVANFNGKNKNKTTIKDKAFIGCNTVIIAPSKIGKGAVTGAGAVITRNSDIKDNSVVVGIPAKPLIKKYTLDTNKKKKIKKRKK